MLKEYHIDLQHWTVKGFWSFIPVHLKFLHVLKSSEKLIKTDFLASFPRNYFGGPVVVDLRTGFLTSSRARLCFWFRNILSSIALVSLISQIDRIMRITHTPVYIHLQEQIKFLWFLNVGSNMTCFNVSLFDVTIALPFG